MSVTMPRKKDVPEKQPNNQPEDIKQELYSLAELVTWLIEYYGQRTDRINRYSGKYENLRRAEQETGVSRTALSYIKIGKTVYPEPATFQAIAATLQRLEPPLLHPKTKQPIRPTWLELMQMNANAVAAKQAEASSETNTPASEKELTLSDLSPDELQAVLKLAKLLKKLE